MRSQMTGNHADARAYKRTAVFMHTCEQWFAIARFQLHFLFFLLCFFLETTP